MTLMEMDNRDRRSEVNPVNEVVTTAPERFCYINLRAVLMWSYVGNESLAWMLLGHVQEVDNSEMW